MSVDLYPSRTTSVGLESDTGRIWPISGSGGEIDLRQEFYEFLYGSPTEVAKGRPAILRRMRRDSDGNLVRCPCVDELTGEPDKDTFCPYCWGEGSLFDEEWITVYKMLVSTHEGMVRKNQPHEPGVSNIPFVFFYCEYFISPTRQDRIIEVSLDTSGRVVTPIVREAIYTIATPEAFRSDNGRVEYWRCAATLDFVKSTWQ